MRRWLLAALLAPPARAALSCVDEDGTPVDWWFLYKQPRWADKGRQEPVGNGEGDTYVYASSARNYEWKVGATVVNSSTCLLGKNLEGIYDGTVENFVLYNDQLPNGSWTRDFGHSKGWFAWDLLACLPWELLLFASPANTLHGSISLLRLGRGVSSEGASQCYFM